MLSCLRNFLIVFPQQCFQKFQLELNRLITFSRNLDKEHPELVYQALFEY